MNKQELKKLEDKIIEIFLKHNKKNHTMILGLSGGPDSIFALQMLRKFSAKTGSKIIIAHINHQLRGKESDKDEEFIKKQCQDLEVFVKKADIKALSKNMGLEETGRKVRYDFFKKLAKKHKAKYVITAHHADDNLETIILNFSRGATLKGLSGMEETSYFSSTTQLFRPLLSIPKTQILDYLKTKDIPYRIDKSNKDTDFTRNHVRHKIIPELKKINPNINKTIAKNASSLREIQKQLENQAKNWIQRNKVLNAKTFRKKSRPLQKEILIQLHKKMIGHSQNIESVHLEEVIKLIEANVGNKKKKLGKVTISIKNNTIYCLH